MADFEVGIVVLCSVRLGAGSGLLDKHSVNMVAVADTGARRLYLVQLV